MKSIFRVIIFLFCCVLFSSCTHHKNTYEAVAESDTTALFQDASYLMEIYESKGGTHGEIPKAIWPASFIDLDPMIVRTFHEGILLRTSIDDRYERGIYFNLNSPEREPGSGSGISHSKISNGIYSTEVKIRPKMKLKKLKLPNKTEPAS